MPKKKKDEAGRKGIARSQEKGKTTTLKGPGRMEERRDI